MFIKPDENAAYRLNRHPDLPVQLRGKAVPLRYYTVEVDAETQHTETKGAILFVHGFRDCALYFERIARCFASRGYRAFLLELPGYDARSWGSSVQLDEYTIAAFSEYLLSAVEALGDEHQVQPGKWVIWGHSMGGAIVYRAMAQNPDRFLQFDRVVLEAPAFASQLTFGSKFVLGLSGPLHKSAAGRYIGRKMSEIYYATQKIAPETLSYKPLEVEGFTDSYEIFQQVKESMKHPSNDFDSQTLQGFGGGRLLWIWSQNDPAVHAKPPEAIPVKQQIRLSVGHTSSLVAPHEVCEKVCQKFEE